MVFNRRTRKLNRMCGYDYTRDGYYFVTICVEHRECIFGEIVDEEMRLNNYGNIVSDCWYDLPNHYVNCILDGFVVMPNHVHGIVRIDNDLARRKILKQNDDIETHVGNGLKPFPTNGVKNSTIVSDVSSDDVSAMVGNGLKPFPTDVAHENMIKTKRLHSLSEIIRGFKTFSSRRINEIADFHFQWQKSFHDHIIRNQKSLEYIQNYMVSNPLRWNEDSINPKNLKI